MLKFTKDEVFTISLALKTLKLECEETKLVSNSAEFTEALQLRINDCNNAYLKIVAEYNSLTSQKN